MHSEDYILTYKTAGTGLKTLILFHGFGQSGAIYDSWIPVLGKEYTIYLVDLYFHGNSTAPFKPLHRSEWIREFKRFLTQADIIGPYSVAGFSLGGRFAIPVGLELANEIERLILIGPDAIYLTPWFHMATSPFLKPIFRYFMYHPKTMDLFINGAVRLRLVSTYLAEFVRRELGSGENRKRVFRSWNYFKPLGYNKKQLRQLLAGTNYDTHLILGSKDIVIPPGKILPIVEGLDFDVHVLDKKHHQLIKKETAQLILKLSK